MANQKLNHCKLPLSPCSPQVTKWQTARYKAALLPRASWETGGPRPQVYWDGGYTQLWCCVGLPTISQGHVGSRRSPTPPSADGTRAPWEMSRLSHSLGPAWQHPASSLTGEGCGGGLHSLFS